MRWVQIDEYAWHLVTDEEVYTGKVRNGSTGYIRVVGDAGSTFYVYDNRKTWAGADHSGLFDDMDTARLFALMLAQGDQ